MNVQSLKLVYFSPTGTTKKIVEEISKGIQVKRVKKIDCTKLSVRVGTTPTFRNELVVLGVPVYYGRVPVDVANYLKTLTADKAFAVLVVVYGNRAYEDALKELHDIAANAGFIPVAGGAFIGEHSFSSEKIPIAHGRPDSKDIKKAREFGKKIREKLYQIEDIDDIGVLSVPGSTPYREITPLKKTAPVTKKDTCIECGICADVCPTASINRDDVTKTDIEKCIVCFACIKACPTGAKVMNDPQLKNIMKKLNTNCQVRKEPEIYL